MANRLMAVCVLYAGAVANFFPGYLDEQKIAKDGAIVPLTMEQTADLLAIHQRYLDAIAAYKQIAPSTGSVQNKLGMAYEHMFMAKDAKNCYEEALRMDPGLSAAFNNLATVYYGEQNYHRAEKLYKRAIQLDPQSASSYHNLGTLYFSCKKSKKGAEAYRKAFQIDPTVFNNNVSAISENTSFHDLAAVSYTLARTYAQAGMKVEAMHYLRRAFGEGFKDGRKVRAERDFAVLRGTPEFERLLAQEGIH